MRIVVVLASPYPAPRGSQLLVKHVEEGLRRRGHRVEVVSYGRWLRDRTGLHPARPLLDLLTLARVLRAARRLRAQVLHAHNYEAGAIGIVASRMLGIPLVYHGHSLMADELPSYAPGPAARRVLARVGAWLDRAVPRRADHCVAVTSALATALRAGGATRVTAIRPTADPHEVRSFGAPAAESAMPTICYAGNLDGYQNLALLQEAFRHVRAAMPEARLAIVTHVPAGRGSTAPEAGVEIVRATSLADAWRALGRAWVAVVPRVDPSGHPMKVLNYMAAGKAIVATREAAHGLRHDVDAVIVPPEPKAFASAILCLLRDAERRARLGAAAREAAASDAAWHASMTTLEDVYRGVRRGGARDLGAPATEET